MALRGEKKPPLSLMSNRQYLAYLLDRTSGADGQEVNCENYFCFEQACARDKRIVPYLFTLSKSSRSEAEGFKVFYRKYLDKAGIDAPADWDTLVASIDADPVMMVTFVAAAQYYFL